MFFRVMFKRTDKYEHKQQKGCTIVLNTASFPCKTHRVICHSQPKHLFAYIYYKVSACLVYLTYSYHLKGMMSRMK